MTVGNLEGFANNNLSFKSPKCKVQEFRGHLELGKERVAQSQPWKARLSQVGMELVINVENSEINPDVLLSQGQQTYSIKGSF